MRDMLGEVASNALLRITVVASAALKALLDTTTASGTNLSAAIGEPLTFTFSNNLEVDRTADNAIPNGRIETLQRDSAGDYSITMSVERVTPSGDNAKSFRPAAIVKYPYRSGATLTLGKPGVADLTSSNLHMEDSGANADGLGCLIWKDTTNLEVGYLI
jgi:hypothetical protein